MPGSIVYKGIGIGKCKVVQEFQYQIREEIISPAGTSAEMEAFETVVVQAVAQIRKLKEHARVRIGEEEAGIFEAHEMMAEDPMLLDAIRTKIGTKGFSSEKAVLSARDEFVTMFMNIEDAYIRERAHDVQDVCGRFLDLLLGVNSNPLEDLDEATVVIAKDLKPSQTVLLDENVQGIALEIGSATSHAAIVAKAKGIPTIIGEEDITQKVKDGDLIVIDARKNKILINPNANVLYGYREQAKAEAAEKERLAGLRDLDAVTLDGRRIKLYGNIGSAMEAKRVGDQGGRGVGLTRTEFLYMDNSHFPTEEEQFIQYRKITESAGEEVIIRTLDIGGDKTLPYFSFPEELNPFLGFRALRFCLERRDIFDVQLRAILRASAYGKVKIMFPMIATLDEFRKAKQCVENAKDALRNEGIPFDEAIETGIMVEIPSAAIFADILAKECDFFSIGTNDLCQYALAVDRMNPHIKDLYQPMHPAIIRLIKGVVEAGHGNGREVGVCGELGSDELGALMLLGLGIDELSVSLSMIPVIKERIRSVRYEDLKEWVAGCLDLDNEAAVKEELERRLS